MFYRDLKQKNALLNVFGWPMCNFNARRMFTQRFEYQMANTLTFVMNDGKTFVNNAKNLTKY